MATNQLIPAAQYLRMSTEHQQYSLENQSVAIQKYAELHSFEIVQTYADTAKSGVILRHRTGLQRLLQDVVTGIPSYRAILVCDVSRWGRFQDTDEAAHYEFLCKSAGTPVHYCAETFANDGTLPSLIMKALKRTMAGEYSRELGVKVLAGQKRLALLGFKQGGRPGYGLRRMLVSPDRVPKQTLATGQRKSIATDRVILVHGPAHEVQVVREIFEKLVSGQKTVYSIARDLNSKRIEYLGTSKWDYQAVHNILTNLKYAGCHVFCRTSRKLYTPTVRLPKSDWIMTPGAFEPIVDTKTFEKAQAILDSRTFNKSDEEVLDELRKLLKVSGRLCHDLIRNCSSIPAPSTYIKRFGSLKRAYELIGYCRPEQFGPIDMRRRTLAFRQELLARIIKLFPEDMSLVKKNNRWRDKLRLSDGRTVSVMVVRSIRAWKETVRWIVDPHPYERRFVTLVARLNETNDAFLDLHLMPRIERRSRFWLKLHDPWLKGGKQIGDLMRLREAISDILRGRKFWNP